MAEYKVKKNKLKKSQRENLILESQCHLIIPSDLLVASMTLRSNLVSISSCWSRTTKWVFVSLLSGYSAHNIGLLRFNLLFWGLSWKDFFWGAITCSLWLMCSLWYISSGILFQLKRKIKFLTHSRCTHRDVILRWLQVSSNISTIRSGSQKFH